MGNLNNDVSNVTTGKPKITGAIFVAPVGTTLPTNPTATLDAAFEGLGFVSEDGLVNGTNIETESVKAWGGQTVLVTRTSTEDTFRFKLIEIIRLSVMQFVYGADHVTGNLDSGIALNVNGEETDPVSIVIDMILKGGILKRIVVPNTKVSNVEDIEYTDSDAVGYDTTTSCSPDEAGNTHYEYIQRPAATQNPGTEDPGTEDPGTEDPGTEDPGTEDPGTENP